MPGFIGVHLGAGDHAESLVKEYQKLSNKACKKAFLMLESGASAVNACTEAIMILEDSPLTNAGFGSNCTWEGDVECDASLMDGHSLQQGAVGAVTGVKNPVCLARNICMERSERLSMGLIPPSMLVGDSARAHAAKVGVELVPPEALITAEQQKRYNKYKRRVTIAPEDQMEDSGAEWEPARLDTVGAVCVDAQGHVAAACSSGGIMLKTKGRVGQAGIPGFGCWAQDARGDVDAVAVSSSGCGEQLIRTFLVRETATMLEESICAVRGLKDALKLKYLESPLSLKEEEKLAGLIVLKYNPMKDVGEFIWGHTTKTMCVGLMSTSYNNPMCRVSLNTKPGEIAKVEGTAFRCRGRFS